MKQNTNNRKGATWPLAESTGRDFLVYLQGALFNTKKIVLGRGGGGGVLSISNTETCALVSFSKLLQLFCSFCFL
jgi:hypothetical protein